MKETGNEKDEEDWDERRRGETSEEKKEDVK